MFVFRLQSVLDIKKVREEQCLSEFSEKRREMEKAIDVLHALHEEETRLICQLREQQQHAMNPTEVIYLISYIHVCRERESQQEACIAKIAEEAEEKRQVLLEAVKERKVLEKLKQRKFEECRAAELLSERVTADETAVLRYQKEAL